MDRDPRSPPVAFVSATALAQDLSREAREPCETASRPTIQQLTKEQTK